MDTSVGDCLAIRTPHSSETGLLRISNHARQASTTVAATPAAHCKMSKSRFKKEGLAGVSAAAGRGKLGFSASIPTSGPYSGAFERALGVAAGAALVIAAAVTAPPVAVPDVRSVEIEGPALFWANNFDFGAGQPAAPWLVAQQRCCSLPLSLPHLADPLLASHVMDVYAGAGAANASLIPKRPAAARRAPPSCAPLIRRRITEFRPRAVSGASGPRRRRCRR